MYKKLDEFLLSQFSTDYWFDEGVVIAIDILERFNESDWNKLQDNILVKPLDWKIRFAYCADIGINDEVLIKCLLQLSSIDNNELFESCIDALRVLVNEKNKGIILKDRTIIERVAKVLPRCGVVTRKIYEDFIIKLKCSD